MSNYAEMQATQELIADALEVSWRVANQQDTVQGWRAVRDEISGMTTLAIYMQLPKEIRSDLFTLWGIALERM